MKIARVKATPLNVPVRIRLLGLDKETSLSVCLVEIETDTGLVGHGMTAITEEEVVAAAIDEIAAPALLGEDPLAHERLWEKLYWLLSPRGQTGYASHAIAAIDIALWDLKGKAPRPAGVAPARRRAQPRAGVHHVRIRLLRPRPARRSGAPLGRGGAPRGSRWSLGITRCSDGTSRGRSRT